MYTVVFKPLGLVITAILLAIVLAACGSPGAPQNHNFDHIASVNLNAGDTAAALEAKYGGKVFLFDEPSGVAMLGFSREESELTTLSTESNINRLSTPVEAAGWSAWAGGWSAWAGAEPVNPPEENNSVWEQIGLRQAQTISRNLGAGVTVAVLDTGIDLNHAMFAGRLAASHLWRDYVDNDNWPQEGQSFGRGYGHGTAVAGIILQVAPKATILPIRVLNDHGQGNLDAVISGIYHAVNSGAKIINLSLGSVDFSTALYEALKHARNNQVYIVASTGNTGAPDSVTFPAQTAWYSEVHPFVMGVGSVNHQNHISSFSSFGAGLTFAAPGEANFSAFPEDRIAQFKGTSFATPLVSGALALAYADASATAKPQLFEALRKGIYNSSDYWEKNDSKLQQATLGDGILNIPNLLRSIPGWTEPASRYTSGQNHFPNPGFESALSSNWWLNNAGRSTTKRSGSWGLQVNAWGQAGVTITGLKPNTTYTLIGWSRLSNVDSHAYMGVFNYGGPDFTFTFWDTTYRTRSLTFKTGPANTSAYIGFSASGARAFFDDMRLIEDNP